MDVRTALGMARSNAKLDQADIGQLRDIVRVLAAHVGEKEGSGGGAHAVKAERKDRPFDWSSYSERRIAVRFCYVGWNYHGLVYQADGVDTVEERLLCALGRTRLIAGRLSCRLSRCGRTDRGVSATQQVMALNVRSQLRGGEPGFVRVALDSKHTRDGGDEIDYVHVMNRLLPNDIRVTAWAPVAVEFDARFSCMYRSYRYFFCAPLGMRLDRVREAARHFVGVHDFRNFCKQNLTATQNHVRSVMSFDVDAAPSSVGAARRPIYVFTVRGQAFLWHQVRCMVAVLLMVADGREQPDVVRRMLDVRETPGKPQYDMASEVPLVLSECVFEDMQWRCGRRAVDAEAVTAAAVLGATGQATAVAENTTVNAVDAHMNDMCEQSALKHAVVECLAADCHRMMAGHGGPTELVPEVTTALPKKRKRNLSTTPLMERPRDLSIDEKLAKKVAASKD